MNNEQINLADIIKLFLRHWWQIGAAAVAMAVVALLITQYAIAPTYTSRGSMYVNNNNATIVNEEYVNLADIATSQQLAFTFIEVLTSDAFLTEVQEISGLPYTAAQIKSMVSLAPLNETEIVEVKAVTYYPEHSQILVDTILHNALSEVHRVIGGGSVKVVDEATLPEYPSSPSKSRNVMVGFLLGAVLSMGVIFLLDMFDKRIKGNSDLMEVKEMPLLGVVPDIEYVRAEVKKNEK